MSCLSEEQWTVTTLSCQHLPLVLKQTAQTAFVLSSFPHPERPADCAARRQRIGALRLFLFRVRRSSCPGSSDTGDIRCWTGADSLNIDIVNIGSSRYLSILRTIPVQMTCDCGWLSGAEWDSSRTLFVENSPISFICFVTGFKCDVGHGIVSQNGIAGCLRRNIERIPLVPSYLPTCTLSSS